MTAREAISRFDSLRPNDLAPSLKLACIGEAENCVARELLRETGPAEQITPESELRAAGYEWMYHFRLCMLFDVEAGDYARFERDAAAAQEYYRAYAAHVCRTHAYEGGVGGLKVPS